MNTKKQNKKKKGFTLIELIVVIAIIAILAAIAIPNFLSIQRKARVKADVASAKTIYDATSALIAQGDISATNGVFDQGDITLGTDNDTAKAIKKYLASNGKDAVNTQSIKGQPFHVYISGDESNPSISVYAINGNKRVDFYPNYSESVINNSGGKVTEKPDKKTVNPPSGSQ